MNKKFIIFCIFSISCVFSVLKAQDSCLDRLEKYKLEKIEEQQLAKVLYTLRRSLDKQIDELYAIKREIEALLKEKQRLEKGRKSGIKREAAVTEKEKEKYATLAEYYASMRASKAAKIFDQMPSIDVANILLNMDPESAGKILGYMNPKKAAEVSEKMKELK